jgi:hypothetical protein
MILTILLDKECFYYLRGKGLLLFLDGSDVAGARSLKNVIFDPGKEAIKSWT